MIDRRIVERARAAGWSDGALFDAASVVALFNFMNRWIDATGVQEMPALDHLESGKRIAAHGY